MENQTISENTTTALTPNAYSRSGYTFRGWAKTISGPANFADKEEVIDLASAGETITLYAIWEPNTFASNTMQGFKCESLNPGETATLTDVRDNNTYTVLRLAESDTATSISGKCLMTENLKLGSNIASAGKTGDKIIVNPTTSNYDTDASNSSYESFTLSGTYNLTYVAPDDATSETYPADNTYSNHRFTYADTGDTYVYNTYGSYSWGTALVVCPAGWHLPTITEWGESTGLLGLIASTSTERAATLLGPVYKSPAYGGEFNSSGFNSAHTTSASDGISYWWSSTQKTNEYAHALRLTSTSALVEGQSKLFSKFVGRFVRCIQDAADGTMQSFNCSTLASGGTAVLRDERDNQLYGVYRIPTDSQASDVAGKCFMTDNLRLGMASGDNASGSDAAKSKVSASSNLTLRSSDSNFDTNASNSAYEEFTLSGDQTLTYVPSSTPSAWSDTKSYTNKQYTYGSGDYAFGYYSWGAALVACPSGWRLPIHTEYNNSTSWNKSTTGISYAADNSRATLMTSPWNFKYTGGLYPAGFNYQTTHGYYWSADQSSSDNAYFLILHTDGGTTLYEYSKYVGRAVRCIADEPVTTFADVGVEAGVTTMQDFTGSMCDQVTIGQTTSLVDDRAGAGGKRTYSIKKLKDGNCWMTQNLALYDYALTSSDSNVTSNFTLPSSSTAGFTTSTTNSAKVYYAAEGATSPLGEYSSGSLPETTVYYNVYAATAGYTYYNDGKSYSNVTDSSSKVDVCPAGWRLPTGGPDGDFVALDKAVNARYDNDVGSDRTDASSRNRLVEDGGFTSTGNINGAVLKRVNQAGEYWSSTVYNGTNNYGFYLFNSGIVQPTANYTVNNTVGFAVRCLKETRTISDLTYMQDMTPAIAKNTEVGTLATLTDKRDNTEYKIKKLPDGHVWMIQNLVLGYDKGYTLTSELSNVGSTFYLPKAGYMGSGTSSSTPNSTTAVNFTATSSYRQYSKVAYKTASENGTSGTANAQASGYYDFYTATAGYAYYGQSGKTGSSPYDICPANWRLPKAITSTSTTRDGTGEFRALMDAYGATWSSTDWTANPYASNINTQMRMGDATASNDYAGFVLAGYFVDNGTSLSYAGSHGIYWPSTVNGGGSITSYDLRLIDSSAYPQNYDYRYCGFSVRCLAQ